MASLEQMLKILSPVRPKQLRMASGLGGLASQLRGGSQPGGQLLNQLRGKPGVKPGALSQYLGHIDPDAKMTPAQLAASVRSPKLFAQRGMTSALDDEAQMELATDLIYGPHFMERRAKILDELLESERAYGGIHPNVISDTQHRLRSGDPHAVDQAEGLLEGNHDMPGIYIDELGTDALAMATTQQGSGKRMAHAYEGYQRQQDIPTPLITSSWGNRVAEPSYFETVLRGTPSRARSDLGPDPKGNWHFTNPSQLGHVRGSLDPRGRVFAEELQSDPLEDIPNLPALEGIYGKLGRMLIDRSAEARAPSVSFPDANRIASVRNQDQLPFFQDVYNKRLGKELYDPLAKRGVPLRQENGWTTMDLPEGVLNAIKNDGLLNYKRGGLVR